MKLGEHLENGLTNLGNSLNDIHKRHIEHDLESMSLGLISDYDKIRMLKGDLYRATRGNGETRKIVETIELLEELRAAEFKRKYALQPLLDQMVNCTFLIAIAATLTASIAYPICRNVDSKFCNDVIFNVRSVVKYFQPK